MANKTECRRRTRRFGLPDDFEASVEFGYPTPGSHRCTMALRDLSTWGVSFVLTHELPGIEVGRGIERVRLRVGDEVVRGEFVVTHLTPDETPGSVCGTLFYPTTDADTIKLKRLVASLDG